jgi:3-hydroxyisobutyryl-CoA hydrolase
MGGGYGITSMAPFRIATENTMFAMPEAKLGFFTDICACYSLARLRNNIGFYLGMTGARLKGEDMYISGMANYYIQRKNLEAVFDELKTALPSSTNPKKTVTDVLNKYHESSGKTTLAHEKEIKELFGIKDFREIYRKVSGQTDEFSISTTKALNDQCPPSVGVIHHLVETAKGKSYRECFLRDYKLVQHYIVDPNFAEGVRTVLVEKGAKAFWSHKSILDVTDEDVKKYFTFPSSFENLNV